MSQREKGVRSNARLGRIFPSRVIQAVSCVKDVDFIRLVTCNLWRSFYVFAKRWISSKKEILDSIDLQRQILHEFKIQKCLLLVLGDNKCLLASVSVLH